MPVFASDEDLLKTAQAVQALGATKAAEVLGIARTTAASRLQIAARRGLLGTKPVLPGFEIKSTSAQLGPDGELQREWIRQRPEAGDVYSHVAV